MHSAMEIDRMLNSLLFHGAAALVFATAAACSAADQPQIEIDKAFSNVFAAKESIFRFTVKADKPWKGRAAWSYTTLNNRTIQSGETDVTATPERFGQVEIRFQAPDVKPGTTLRTRLRVSLIPADGKNPDADLHKTIWIFPEDPFSGRKEWLKELKISLFDPEKTTAAALEKLDVPFDPLPSVAAAGTLTQGILLIGEGVSFKDYPDLAITLARLAEAGRPVICLAPVAGTFPVPAPGITGPRLFQWKKQGVIRELDKRLDATAWPPRGTVVAHSFTLTAEDGIVVAEVAAGADGWAWVEAEYPSHGRLVMCGFSMLGKPWYAGPTPRYLLACMLEHITRKPSKTGDEEPEKTDASN
jgi:hypothetical protein